jgi:hypothetical protein
MSQLIYKAMADVMRDIPAVTKDQKNTAQGFKFRGIDQFINSLYPALTKHKVFMAPKCVSSSHELKDVTRSNGKHGVDKHVHLMMEYTFYAEDGSSVTVGPLPSEGLDSGDKATNKALSAALKYALIQTFSIPTEDMEEADFTSPEMGKTVSNKTSPISVDTQTSIQTTPNSTTKVDITLTGPTTNTFKSEIEVPAPKRRSSFRKDNGVKSIAEKIIEPATTGTNPEGWE